MFATRHRFLSTISQRQKVTLYFPVCLGIPTALYLALSLLLTKASSVFAFAAAAPLVLIAYQAINFNHLYVDALIWKVRKRVLIKWVLRRKMRTVVQGWDQ